MKPLVVVQNNFVRRLTDPAALAAHALGITLHDISSGDDVAGRRPLPGGGPWGPILVIGSILFTRQWARGRADLQRWIDWEDANYDAELWNRVLGERFLNHAGRVTTVGNLIAFDSKPVHIRPLSGVKLVGWHKPDENHAGQKSLAGLVVDAADLVEHRIDVETAVWASPPVEIDAEVRTWIIGGKAAAWSTYRVAGAHLRDANHPLCPAAVEAALSISAAFAPGRSFVCDVALSNGEWKLIEYNPIHSSGWYDADPAAIVAAWFAANGCPLQSSPLR